ncbi:MAG: ISAzo13 family transposase [Blastocatellia bacterium]
MELTEEMKQHLIETARTLKGSDRRRFLARTVKLLGSGGQRRAERELHWDRKTIIKGMHELDSGLSCLDGFSWRGRQKSEVHLPHLLDDIKAIVDSQSQTDPRFRTQRLYTRLGARVVIEQLIKQKDYAEADLPSIRTINTKLNELGYHPSKVAKCKPIKKIPETDAIFEHLGEINPATDQADNMLRLSLDAKASVKIGLFSRGGKNRIRVNASDHDFKPDATLTPFGIFLPKFDELFLYFLHSTLTSDAIVDVLEHWWGSSHKRFGLVDTLVFNQDNGPENNSHRTQFMKRLVSFALEQKLAIRLAYYPPYHSKYNAIERCWGALENHWNGDVLDSVETAIHFAETMSWNGKHPLVQLITKTYQKGVRLTAQEMKILEQQFDRLPGLEKWFVDIRPS